MILVLAACGHSEPLGEGSAALGPFGTGPNVLLTLNPNQDYWPIWTEDGAGILYSFIDGTAAPQHRCVGLLPAAGGTRTWQLCDNRAIMADSVSSFPAYALGSDGRLLYVEATSIGGAQSTSPEDMTLWLADSATPFQRHALLTLPTFAGSVGVSWLADIAWTGPGTFIALAQDLSIMGHCHFCGPVDTLFLGAAVVTGTIGAGSTTLTPVAGTTGATGYSLAENGASIVFTLRDDRRLYKVPAGGGSATVVGVATTNNSTQLLGVSCKGGTCVVAASNVVLTTVNGSDITFPSVGPDSAELRGVSIATGVSQRLFAAAGVVLATPQISPLTGDVVVQVGGLFGHAQTATTAGSNLHLFPGLVP